MKFLIAMVIFLTSFSSFAGFSNYCGTVDKMYTWVGGGETYGVWVMFDNNPSVCSGGFYLSQQGNNRELVYSFLLSAKMAKTPICIQTNPEVGKISSRCKINYVVDK
ncbi:conserved exported hypothetical protein [Vibrio nigripulchritudo SO65]|uniref:hypothetical protein n=1 Tax=Vibrio TaxID=662 RepID=UPI0003B1D86A|nr:MULTISPECIES: hypothetical protein [Vibrio]UAB71726.1 hypothetical protein INR79_07465 [Vibrio sp. SCSIO 43132]CCN36185.1 conserved exported hypothetical protein [Vibrio nigripulchritudo AM115]CCN43518.1 conserved exported hypothetical protein [Vibrio nigripulchritudo FTn2]CCN66060.1 conserved exported hypothetical protein [Vibrio nigripulchritudo POn4]CCN78690.1 conserved exported hypothetical protein [Vibrio nigripulchritudo SO65]